VQLHQIEGYIQAVYLVEYQHSLMLLDGCCRADVESIKSFITDELNRPLTDLSLIVVTHMHPDHAGAAAKLREETGCKIAGANITGHWYQGIIGRLMHLADIAATQWVAKKRHKEKALVWYPAKLSLDIKLDDEELLPNFPEWQVLFTQGHTDRDLSLRHLPSNKIYVADLFVKFKQRLSPPIPVFYPKRYQRSLEKIKALSPKAIWLAHDGELAVSDQQFDELIKLAPKKVLTHWKVLKFKLLKFR